jgi:serine/threonine protein kinase
MFVLLRVLGGGGMGVVYLAKDVDLGRQVALKTLPRLLPRAARRLRNEARSMATLEHSSLAQIFGLESWRGVPVLVVEHLAGGTLAQRMDHRWPWREAFGLGSQIADALQTMHARGFVHRDVKPSNIGFNAKDDPKLLDFGLAQIAAEARGAGDEPGIGPGLEAGHVSDDYFAGTPLYIPPGGAAGRGSSTAQDLWGLSMVVYELIAGAHPFRARLRPTDLERGRLPVVPDVRGFYPACPEPVALLLSEALACRPERRPPTAGELKARLDDLRERLEG